MTMNPILQDDLDSFRIPPELTDRLRGTTIIVTGATGLVGAAFVRCVNALRLGVSFILPVRNVEKAESMLADVMESADTDKTCGSVTVIDTDLSEFFNTTAVEADYIIHCASPTDGKYMSEFPVETFTLPIETMSAIARYALRIKQRHAVKSIVYVSSIEFYGRHEDDGPVVEAEDGYIDRQSPRSSYALGKRAAEYLAFSYSTEYGVPVKSARLTQTFGAGVSPTDRRVFAEFARSAIEGRDIVLHTKGLSAKPYCYITDCVSALIFILLKGADGESYNVATPGTYISIAGLARLFRDRINPDIDIRIEPAADRGYAPDTQVNLCADRLMILGWRPQYTLPRMLERLTDYMEVNEYSPKGDTD